MTEPKKPEVIVQEQAKKLGGSWCIDPYGFMPVVMLTTEAAAILIEKIQKKAPHEGLLAVRYIAHDDQIYVFPPDQIEFVYDTDGI